MFHGFDYSAGTRPATPSRSGLPLMAGAIDWVLDLPAEAAAAKDDSDEGKKQGAPPLSRMPCWR